MAGSRKGRKQGVGATGGPLPLPAPVVPAEREKPRPALLGAVAFAGGVLLFLFLLRFAVDILLWILVLVLFALVLHYITIWLAQSELLSAPWLLIIALAAGAATWMLWPGSSFQQGDLTQYLPGPVAQALEWAEERHLTRRALVATPAPAEAREPAARSRVEPPPSRPVSTGGGTGLGTVSVSVALTGVTASRVGEPVTLVATVRAGGRSPAELAGVVQFLDGFVLLGEAVLQPAGNSRRASLTVTGLSEGEHRITASYAGATSAALVHTVAGG